MKSGSIKIFLTVCMVVCSLMPFLSASSIAQTTSPGGQTVVVSDTTEAADTVASSTPVRKKDKRPRNATIMSALVPGLGQIYNKRYWKLPILYGLGGLLGYAIVFDNKNYREFKLAYEDTINLKNPLVNNYIRRTGSTFNGYNLLDSPERLKSYRDDYRRDRDFYVILSLGLYVLNILDAAVDAHLKNFDVSDKLTLQLDPKFNAGIGNSLAPGISMNFKFKK